MKPRAFLAARLAVLALLVAVAGCVSGGGARRATLLDATLTRYAKMIRWGEFEEAARMIRFRDREPVTFDMHSLRGIRVTAYDTIENGVNATHDEARILARISYYDAGSGVVHTFEDAQTWWYEEASGLWWLDGVLPDFAGAAERR
ncbi:MAG: hypothetical protein AB7Q97_06930 [Gammaproteobacteria bacterium]